MSKIPATVITGFLGAGKTTLLRHLLRHANGARLALLINEFGDVGVDQGIVEGCGIDACGPDDMIELTNGCICCTVADDFLPAMKTLLDRPRGFDHIVIETSGLALPKPLVQAFRWPEVRARTTVSGVVAVVDSAQVAEGRFARAPANQPQNAPAHDYPLEEVFEDQLRVADLAVLNKTDLVDQATLAGVRARVEAALPDGAKAVSATRGALPLAVVLGIGAGVEDAIHARPALHDAETNHNHDDFASFVVEIAPTPAAPRLEARVRAVMAEAGVLRVKGFAEVAGRPMRLVIQAAGPRVECYFDRPWGDGEARLGRLVVIGLKGLDRARIADMLRG